MSDLGFAPDAFDESPSYQHLNPQENISQFLGELQKIPQNLSDNLQPRGDDPSRSGHVHELLYPRTASSINEDFASEFGSGSRHSGASRDSGYFSINGASSISSLKDGHRHWCFICRMPRAITTCDGWKRHMKEHETTYPCLECQSQNGSSIGPTFTRKANLVTHLRKSHGHLLGSIQADNWRQTPRKKYYSCGFCICLFQNLPEYLNHIDYAHFQYHQTLEHWDQNKVILGLLQQPRVADAWQRILPPNLDQDAFTWDFPAISDLKRGLELREDEPEALAKLAFLTSMNNITRRYTDVHPEFSTLRLEDSPKASDNRTWHSTHLRRSYGLSESEADLFPGFSLDSWTLQNHSRRGPWNPLHIHEGEWFPITSHGPFHAMCRERKEGSSDHYSTAANDNRNLADTQEVGIRLSSAIVTDSALSSKLLLQPMSFLPNNRMTSGLHPCSILDQHVGDNVQASQKDFPSGHSVGLAVERKKICSSGEDKKDIKQSQGIRKCRICRERSLHCTHVIPSLSNSIAKATTATEYSTEVTDHRQNDKDHSQCEESVKCIRERKTHESSQSRTDASYTATAMSPESEYTSASSSEPPYSSFDLNIAQAKHELMVTLMKEVYAMFDSKWKANVRTCATSRRQESSGTHAQPSQIEAPRASKHSKKRMKDRDSSPPGKGNGKRKKKDDPKVGLHRQFACPFHKYDPYKYSLNSDTGATYKSCMGPGSVSISHLKQHLRRTHRAPIQCQRCWHVLLNLQEMRVHANMEPRCDGREGQPEGVDQEKLDHIFSIHGPSWEEIYEILFPGAPVPSPYYEAEVQPAERFAPSSPASEELEQFEEYSRTALPRLVEANLQAIVNAEMVPIEENLRRLLVDIVRRCQSTVAENFRVFRVPRRASVDPPQPPSSNPDPPLPPSRDSFFTESQLLAPPAVNATLDFFQEPPPVTVEAGPSCTRPPEGTGFQSQFTDSAYGGSLESCDCNCHDGFVTDNFPNDARSCEKCTNKHFDSWNLSFEDFIRGSEQ